MKVVFLDFDGVLNHIEWMKGHAHPRPPFDPACLRRLGQICERTGAGIVVSSSWRAMTRGKGVKERLAWLRGLLLGAGLGARGEIVGMTPEFDGDTPRADEIRAYLVKHPAESFAILDDEAFAGVGLEAHFVRTDFERGGLLDEHVEAAVRILGGRPC